MGCLVLLHVHRTRTRTRISTSFRLRLLLLQTRRRWRVSVTAALPLVVDMGGCCLHLVVALFTPTFVRAPLLTRRSDRSLSAALDGTAVASG